MIALLNPPPSETSEQQLERLCEATLEVLRQGDRVRTSVAEEIPALIQTVAAGAETAARRLLDDLTMWQTFCQEVSRLSQRLPGAPNDSSPCQALVSELSRLQGQVNSSLHTLAKFTESLADYDDHRATTNGFENRVNAAPAEGPSSTAISLPIEGDETPTIPSPPDVAPLAVGESATEGGESGSLTAESLLEAQREPSAALDYESIRQQLLQGRHAAAIDELTRHIVRCNSDPAAYWWRGNALSIAGRYREAATDYARSLELAPRNLVVRYNRAVALRQAGEWDAALHEFEAMVELQPHHATLYLNRGLIFVARDNLVRAAAEFRMALRFAPDSQEAAEHLRTTEAALRQGRPIHVAPVIDLAAERRGDTAPALAKGARSLPGPSQSSIASPAQLPFDCPRCGRHSSVRWDRLQPGKVLACPGCDGKFTVHADGSLGELKSDGQGQLAEVRSKNTFAALLGRPAVLGTIAICGLLLVILLVAWGFRGRSASSMASTESSLPPELEARAELFARAWLVGDNRLMRRLTDPARDRQVFSWSRRTPAPMLSDDPGLLKNVRCQIAAITGPAPATWLHIRLENIPTPTGPAFCELFLAWEQHGQDWMFEPIGTR